MKKLIKFISFIVLFATFSSCENYWGDKTDLSFIEVPEQSFREVAYVPVQPILNQFVSPTDIIAGFDELIYVVDNGSQEVIALDESGRELSRKFIQGAKAIAQDRRLNLLVLGTIDDVDNPAIKRSCIYRLNLSGSIGYGLQYSAITDSVIHPFYFKTNAISSDAEVVFNGIAVLNDNSYYVTRKGPRISPTKDDAVLLFDKDDNFITPIIISDNRGAIFNDYFEDPFDISTLVKPPQINTETRGDFIFTSIDPNGVLNVQQIQKMESVDGVSYVPKTDWSNDTTLADNFINEPFKFKEPTGVEFTGDGTNYIFVIDKSQDSLFQFTSTGLEGVQPPPASGGTKYIKTSFGGTGVGASQFNNPSAVAYKNRIVYVADAGNGRVLRFKLTLDIR